MFRLVHGSTIRSVAFNITARVSIYGAYPSLFILGSGQFDCQFQFAFFGSQNFIRSFSKSSDFLIRRISIYVGLKILEFWVISIYPGHVVCGIPDSLNPLICHFIVMLRSRPWVTVA